MIVKYLPKAIHYDISFYGNIVDLDMLTRNIISNDLYKDKGGIYQWAVYIVKDGYCGVFGFCIKNDKSLPHTFTSMLDRYENIIQDICSIEFVNFIESSFGMDNVQGIVLVAYGIINVFLQKIYIPIKDLYDIATKNYIEEFQTKEKMLG